MKFQIICKKVEVLIEGQKYVRFVKTLRGYNKTVAIVTKVYPNEIRYTLEGVEGELAIAKNTALQVFRLLIAREVTSEWTANHYPFSEEGWKIAFNLISKPVKQESEQFPTINGRLEDDMVWPYQN